MALYPVGPSSYGELAGITQYVTNAEVAEQVNSLIDESRAVFAGGAFLSVNEGVRSRARQSYLRGKWEAYRAGGPWAALAAALFFSTHDESRGNALDFGVTNADGSNRSLTISEHTWLVARGRERGIVWTGGDPSFMSPSELWHFNAYLDRATIPPLPPTPELSEEDDMTPKQEQDLENVKQSVARLERALIGDGKYTLVKNVETIKKSQARVEVLANTISKGVGKLLGHFTLKP